jgi:hypothetical protein
MELLIREEVVEELITMLQQVHQQEGLVREGRE